MQAIAVPLPVLHRRNVVGVGVAVVAEVRAGVVLADVLRHDAAAGETLAFVFQLRVLAGNTDVGFKRWQGRYFVLSAKRSASAPYRIIPSEKIHQALVM